MIADAEDIQWEEFRRRGHVAHLLMSPVIYRAEIGDGPDFSCGDIRHTEDEAKQDLINKRKERGIDEPERM